MCMEDKKIGRALASIASVVQAPNATSGIAAPADAKRTFIAFHTAGAAVRIAPEGIDVTQNGAFSLTSTAQPLEFDVETYGGLVTRPWTCSGVAGIVPIIVCQSTLERME